MKLRRCLRGLTHKSNMSPASRMRRQLSLVSVCAVHGSQDHMARSLTDVENNDGSGCPAFGATQRCEVISLDARGSNNDIDDHQNTTAYRTPEHERAPADPFNEPDTVLRSGQLGNWRDKKRT